MPPLPKPADERRRRNKTAGARTLRQVEPGTVAVPELPAGSWHPQVLRWWSDVWASPMAPEWDDSDIHGLFELAGLMHRYWLALEDPETSAASLAALAGQLRQGRQQYGLSPLDRRRLEWEIDKAEEAGRRRTARKASAAPRAVKDPRSVDGTSRTATGDRKGA